MTTVSQENYVMEIASPKQDWAKQKKTAQRKERMKLGSKIKYADSQSESGISMKGNCRKPFFFQWRKTAVKKPLSFTSTAATINVRRH